MVYYVYGMDIFRKKMKKTSMYYVKYDLQLFAKEGAGGEKTEEPTAKKLNDARKKGQTAKSIDFTAAVALLLLFVILKIYLGSMGNLFLETYNDWFQNLAKYKNSEFDLNIACSLVGEVFIRVIQIAAPFFVVIFVVTIITLLFQVKWKISFEPMKPKLSKFSPISGAKRLFSKDKLIDLLKSILKQAAMVIVVYDFLQDRWPIIYNMYSYTLPQALAIIGDIIINIGLRISMIFLIISFGDMFYQKWKFHQDMKMTKQEVKDEYKQSEGDPKVKSQQRARMRQAAQRRMMQDLPKADVVITNPTHLAVAIKYDKEEHEAPVVIAKGADYLAERIKNVARENAIEIVENKPLARMLYHNVEIGSQIPPELYQMVAEVLAYVYGLKGKL